ncbi:MAG: cytochrome c maturation protein CcmE [Anaerolineae bacterium]|nr:cytochrome c maturation protein CcmE [Anaerolineae bacterium]
MADKTKYLIAGLLVAAAALFLMLNSTGSSARYFMTIEELRQMGQEAGDRSFTVSGAVLGDTIQYDPSLPVLRFTIAQVPGDPEEVKRAGGLAAVLDAAVRDPNAPRLEIVYRDVKPDLLQHRTQAIVRGRLDEDGRFQADEILLRCPTRYQEDAPAQVASS